MYKIYNKKTKIIQSNAQLGLIYSSNPGLIIQTTATFTLAFRKPIT